MVIVYRSVKGSNLTPTEVDDNFHDVDDRITTIEGIDLGKSIASIEVPTDGTTMTITYTDATTDTFTLPVLDLTQVFKGEWQPLTPYFAGNLITAAGGFYCVLQDHTSGSPDFDPNATLGTAGDLYQLWFSIGTTPVYTRSATTFDPLFGDANSYNRCTHASGCTVTLPDNADVPFPIGTELHFRQCTNGSVFIESSTAVTINPPAFTANNTDLEGAVVTLKKVATDEWDLFGKLQVTTAT